MKKKKFREQNQSRLIFVEFQNIWSMIFALLLFLFDFQNSVFWYPLISGICFAYLTFFGNIFDIFRHWKSYILCAHFTAFMTKQYLSIRYSYFWSIHSYFWSDQLFINTASLTAPTSLVWKKNINFLLKKKHKKNINLFSSFFLC